MDSTCSRYRKKRKLILLLLFFFFLSSTLSSFLPSYRSNSLASNLSSSRLRPSPASRQVIYSCCPAGIILRLSIGSDYGIPPSVKALNLRGDHSVSNNDSRNTDVPAPVTGYAAQMMIVMTRRGGRDSRRPTANRRAAASPAFSHPPVPRKQQHLSLSPLLCPSVWFL